MAARTGATLVHVAAAGSLDQVAAALQRGSVVLVGTLRDPRVIRAFHGRAFAVQHAHGFRLSLLTIDYYDGGKTDTELVSAAGAAVDEATITNLRTNWVHAGVTPAGEAP